MPTHLPDRLASSASPLPRRRRFATRHLGAGLATAQSPHCGGKRLQPGGGRLWQMHYPVLHL